LKDLPSVRASILEPFYLAAKDLGSPVESTLQLVGLPTQLPEENELLLLETNCWRFIHSIANKEACSTFGLIAADTKPWPEIVTVQPLFKDCLNLYELLKRLVIFAPTQSITSVFTLIEDGDYIWFVNLCPRLLPEKESIQVELFDVLGMIQLVQSCAGKTWRPEEIHLTIKHDYEVENASQLNPSRILFSKPHAKFKIPRKILSLPILSHIADKCIDATDIDLVESIPDLFPNQLVSIVSSYMGVANIDKNTIANALDISPRTLHRHLEYYSTSFSSIIDSARFDRAQQLLKISNLSLIEISLILGYKNASSFTRSFRRLSGVSPKEYRLFN